MIARVSSAATTPMIDPPPYLHRTNNGGEAGDANAMTGDWRVRARPGGRQPVRALLPLSLSQACLPSSGFSIRDHTGRAAPQEAMIGAS